MVITFYGVSCFRVQLGDFTIAFDPPSKTSSLKPPRFEADIIFSSHNHILHNGLEELSGKKTSERPFFISGPGEYEVSRVWARGISSFHDNEGGKTRGQNTIYTLEVEDIRLCHLGDLGTAQLEASTLEEIGEVDLLFVPIGGKDVLDPEGAATIAGLIEPKILIPMHYHQAKTAIGEFLKELGEEKIVPEAKWTLKKKDLHEEGSRIVLLEPLMNS